MKLIRAAALMLAALLILAAPALGEAPPPQIDEPPEAAMAIEMWAQRVTGCDAGAAETRQVDIDGYGYLVYMSPYRLDVGYCDGLLHRFVYFNQGAFVEGKDELVPMDFATLFGLAGSLIDDMRQNYAGYVRSRYLAAGDLVQTPDDQFKALIIIDAADIDSNYMLEYNLAAGSGTFSSYNE